MRRHDSIVVGVGEVGGALAEIIEQTFPVWRQDLEPLAFGGPIDVMHLCIPYRTAEQFEQAAMHYIESFKPRLTIINSTVVPGTTRALGKRSGKAVAFSPVRGKHANMKRDLMRYAKFVAAPDAGAAEAAQEYFQQIGMKTRRVRKVEALELAKLAETTYFGVLIGFAQEINRYAGRVGANYEEVIDFFEEINFLPSKRYFPGFIGGHCVIPNINLLQRLGRSSLFEAILDSNRRRAGELDPQTESGERRINEAQNHHEGKLLADR
jgi:UDP-glucose 6-dehydrogenase